MDQVEIPFDREREDAVIASILIGGLQVFDSYQEIIDCDCFLSGDARHAWDIFQDRWRRQQDWTAKVSYDVPWDKTRPEAILISWASPESKSRWLDPCWQIYTYGRDLPKVCAPLIEARTRREVMKWCEDMLRYCQKARDFNFHEAMEELGAIGERQTPLDPDECLASNLAVDAVIDIERRYLDRESSGIATLLQSLNQMVGGLRPGNLVVLGALPGGGKTAWGCNLIWHTSRQGKRVLMVSAEMTRQEIMARIFSLESGVSAEKIITRARRLTQGELQRVIEAAAAVKGRPLIVDDRAQTTAQIRKSIRTYRATGPVDLVVVDYLQYLRPAERAEKLREKMLAVTLELKGIAKEFSVPVVALAQLSRQANDVIPSLRHFAETSQIEKEADIALILFATRDEKVLKTLELRALGGYRIQVLKVDKNRNGRTGVLELSWNPELMLFSDQVVDEQVALA